MIEILLGGHIQPFLLAQGQQLALHVVLLGQGAVVHGRLELRQELRSFIVLTAEQPIHGGVNSSFALRYAGLLIIVPYDDICFYGYV